MTYIAFLRAINVAGRTVTMARLRELFADLGLANVRSYIQSGNIFFETDETDREALTLTIERHLRQALGYEVGVFLRTIPEVEHLLALDPFGGVEVTPDLRLCVVFVATAPRQDLALPLTSPRGDATIVGVTPGEILLVLHLINGRPADATKFLATVFAGTPSKGTMRFWGTTAKILAAARRA